MSTDVFLQRVILDERDVWNGDGRGVERVQALLEAVRDLPFAATSERADALYWAIDNVAVVQGGLFPAGPKILPALLDALFLANDVGRPRLLEAIFQIARAEMVDESLSARERERLGGDMIRTVGGALRYFMHLAVHGGNEEAGHALDLIALVVAPPHPAVPRAEYEADLRVLLDVLEVRHPARHRDLKRNLSG